MPRAADPIIDRLLGIATEERRLLIRGDLERLGRLEPLKVELIGRLRQRADPADPIALDRLRRAAQENQTLYRAALLAVRHVRDQVSALLEGGSREFKTYSARGDRQPISKAGPRLEKRA